MNIERWATHILGKPVPHAHVAKHLVSAEFLSVMHLLDYLPLSEPKMQPLSQAKTTARSLYDASSQSFLCVLHQHKESHWSWVSHDKRSYSQKTQVFPKVEWRLCPCPSKVEGCIANSWFWAQAASFEPQQKLARMGCKQLSSRQLSQKAET